MEKPLRQMREERGHPDEVESPSGLELRRIGCRLETVHAELARHEVHRISLDLGRPHVGSRMSQREEAQMPAVAAGEVEDSTSVPIRGKHLPEQLLRGVVLLQRDVEILADREVRVPMVTQRILEHLVVRMNPCIQCLDSRAVDVSAITP